MVEDVIPIQESIISDPVTAFIDASANIAAATIKPPYLHECKLQAGSLIDDVIRLFEIIESPSGVDSIQVYTHSTLYYRIRVESPLNIHITSTQGSNYVGELLGHPFFAHPRIRPNTIIVTGAKGGRYNAVVGTQDIRDNQMALFY